MRGIVERKGKNRSETTRLHANKVPTDNVHIIELVAWLKY